MDLYDEIARVAYELYEKSGYIQGCDREHWLKAEKIVKGRLAEGGKKKEEKKIKSEKKPATKPKNPAKKKTK
jgi:hypothetical protein